MKVHHVKRARKDYWKKGQNGEEDSILIAKGTPYYWWKFKNQVRVISINPPRPAQLRAKYGIPEFEIRFPDLADMMESDDEDQDEVREEIEAYRDELQERLDNMPYQLQESSILNEYIEKLSNLLNE